MAKLKAPKAHKLTNPMLQQHTASSSAQMAPRIEQHPGQHRGTAPSGSPGAQTGSDVGFECPSEGAIMSGPIGMSNADTPCRPLFQTTICRST
jgi:hypothetical protein